MNNTKYAIFITIFACIGLRTNYYTVVSRKKIIQLLMKHHKITASYRWVGECIKFLEKEGYISRRFRYDHNCAGYIKQFSSILAPTIKGAKFLIKRRVEGASIILKNILSWLKKPDGRYPTKKDISPAALKEIEPETLGRLEDMAKMVIKPFSN